MSKSMIRMASVAASLMLCSLSPAQAQVSTVTQSTASGAQTSDSADQRRICVRTSVTGTRLSRSVCRTAAEWQRDGGIPRSN